jgi:putative acetyltransferase
MDFRSMLEIRFFIHEDAAEVAQLFHDTVREVNVKDYSLAQVEAWAPADLSFRNWSETCAKKLTYVAFLNRTLVGFAELEYNGKIGCFYCHKDYQRQGIGRKLYQKLETTARELYLPCLQVEASITAKPFFDYLEFSIIRKQQVYCRGQQLINYLMKKQL